MTAGRSTHPVLFASCVDSLYPQRPHVSLLLPSVSVRVLQSLLNSLFSYTQAVAVPAAEALGKLKDFVFLHAVAFHAFMSQPLQITRGDLCSWKLKDVAKSTYVCCCVRESPSAA